MNHYYSKNQTSEFNVKKIKENLLGFDLVFNTSPGVFSKRKVDRGTKALIKFMQVKKDQRVLDMGCGYGPVGVVCAKLGAKPVLVDVNPRAVLLAKRNLKENNVWGKAFQSSFYSKVGDGFDVILSNPPIAAGRSVCVKIIEDSVSHLRVGGSLQFVARHHHGGKALQDKMVEFFGNVEVLGKSGGFWVYKSVKK
ncbi:MAG: class I SAM-dependent methyltransferase [Nanoarchaeota archaeon]|nr:class I SAM-dependent methyltransferase [Nanoarchaeota archaeon]